MAGAPKFVDSQVLPNVGYAGFAASLGLHAITVTDPDEVGGAWDSALSADRPTVLDVHTDPNMPPIPPHATRDQFKAASAAVLGGDEDRWGFLKEGTQPRPGNSCPTRAAEHARRLRRSIHERSGPDDAG